MELFKGWFADHFLKHVVSANPVLLLLDGHSSHYNLEALRLTKESGVILFTLVPHTTHEMQPLDTAILSQTGEDLAMTTFHSSFYIRI